MTDRLPAMPAAKAPVAPRAGEVARPAVALAAGQLTFGATASTREELWDEVTAMVRQKVEQRAGGRLEWWAQRADDGGVELVVLGPRAFVTVTRTVTSDGRPLSRISELPVRPMSIRSTAVTVAGRARGDATSTATATAGPALVGRIGEKLAELLGNLPPRAQTLLLDPFLDSDGPLLHDAYYYRMGSSATVAGARLYIWAYVSDGRTLTLCGGLAEGYRDIGGAGSWNLTCWLAELAEPADGHR